jgi:type I protein arginine methyltransferase
MFALDDYLRMVEDRVRTPAYLAAMAATIRPGDHVLDLGTGFGYFAVHACRLGAGHVTAVEPNDAVRFGESLAAAHGCAERITFVQGTVAGLRPGRPVDVLVEDLRGVSPLHGTRLGVLRDVTARLLGPGARRIPRADRLVVAPAERPADLPWLSPAHDPVVHGLSLAVLRTAIAGAIHRTRADATALLAPGAAWAVLEYAALPAEDFLAGGATFTVTRAGTLAGLLSWFEADLAEGIGFSTAPGAECVYDRAFLPLGDAVAVTVGDRVEARVRARFDGAEYVWAWEAMVRRADGTETRRAGSDLGSRLMGPARRARRAGDHRPKPHPELARLAALAAAVDGQRSLAEIADRLMAAHPDAFASDHEALRWAGDVLARLDEAP